MLFTILVKEELCRYVEVEAEDSDEAIDVVSEMYDNSEVVLTADDYNDTTMEIVQVIKK